MSEFNTDNKKKYILNCDVCDTRKIVEEHYAQYGTIVINADTVIQSPASKEILSRLPITMNSDQVIEVEDDREIYIETINGPHELTGTTGARKSTLLSVNGPMRIQPGTEEILKNYIAIIVNGPLTYPESLTPCLPKISVNGPTTTYPDGAIILDDKYTPDKYFHIRAKQNAVYYAKKAVLMIDPDVDVKALVQKNVRFLTNVCVIREDYLEEAIALFDEKADLMVVPAGYTAVTEDAELTKAFLNKNGKKIFVYGDLKVTDEGIETIRDAASEYDIVVEGKEKITKRMEGQVEDFPIKAKEIQVVKGKIIKGAPMATCDRNALELNPDGVKYTGIGAIKVAADLTPKEITDFFEFSGVGAIKCSEEQKSAIESVSSGVGSIGGKLNSGDSGFDVLGKDDEGEESMGLLGMMKKGLDLVKNTKLVNADEFVM